MITSILLLNLLSTIPGMEAAPGGTSVAGGGDALVCYEDSDAGLELRERVAEILRQRRTANAAANGFDTNFVGPFDRPTEPALYHQIKEVLSLDLYIYSLPVLSSRESKAFKTFEAHTSLRDALGTIFSEVDRVTNYGERLDSAVPLNRFKAVNDIVELDDSLHEISMPTNCVLVQIAKMDDELQEVRVVEKLFSKMSPLHQLALVLHEKAYHLARLDANVTDSKLIPYIIGPLLEEALDSESLDQWLRVVARLCPPHMSSRSKCATKSRVTVQNQVFQLDGNFGPVRSTGYLHLDGNWAGNKIVLKNGQVIRPNALYVNDEGEITTAAVTLDIFNEPKFELKLPTEKVWVREIYFTPGQFPEIKGYLRAQGKGSRQPVSVRGEPLSKDEVNRIF